MALSVFVLGLIFAALNSALLVASRAADERDTPLSSAADTQRALDWLTADLACATGVSAATATGVTFVVPDRTGDGAADTIRYAWAGNNGPLVRTVNAASAVVVAKANAFALEYDTARVALPATFTESAETTLCSFDPLLVSSAWAVSSSDWIGNWFRPSLSPSSATRWKVTRLQLKLRRNGPANGTVRVQLRNASALGLPTTVIDEAAVAESTLGAGFAYTDVPLGNDVWLAAGAEACVVVQWVNDAKACDVNYASLGAITLSANMVSSGNGGKTWSPGLLQAVTFKVIGVCATPDPVREETRLRAVRVTLRSGGDPILPPARSAVSCANTPVVTP